MTIEANTEIQIHFLEPRTSLENFFAGNNIDPKVENIISIDFSHFNSSLPTNTANILYYCNSLEEINFTNFDTSKVEDMMNMFFPCNELKSLDLSNFKTTNVENMNNMFGDFFL